MRSLSILVALILISCPALYGEDLLENASGEHLVPEKADLSAVPFAHDPMYQEFMKALVSQNKGKFDEASQSYRKVIEDYPRSFAAQYNLGLCFEKQCKWTEAIAAFEEASKLDPYSQAVYRHLIFTANKSGNDKKARAYYAIYLKL